MSKQSKLLVIVFTIILSIPTLMIHCQQVRIDALQTQISAKDTQIDDLSKVNSELQEIVDSWQAGIFKASAYSPLDDRNGLNSWGDGTIMTSGVNTADYIDTGVGVDPEIIPLGSKIYIEGIGWRIATDTGGAIKGYELDIPMWDFDDAMKYGTPEVLVLWPK